MYNFHVFVLISTILYYIILRSYKGSIISNERETKSTKTKSNFIYILFLPILLYIFYYFFIYKKESIVTSDTDNSTVISHNLMSAPYPDSISSI